MSALRAANRLFVLPTVGFTLGVFTFIKAWPDESSTISLKDPSNSPSVDKLLHRKQPLVLQRSDVLNKIAKSTLYQELISNPSVEHLAQSEKIPSGHRPYHVGQGPLFGPSKLEIDPLIFHNLKDDTLVVFYHLGSGLSNEKNKIHKGVLSLLLDEGLCYCGFPLLPSKRGVTAKLSINFEKDVPADSTIILRAKVSKSKGRKCIIDGSLESVPSKGLLNYITGSEPTTGETFATAKCILVEPKWFKYLNWLHVF
ncbi:Mrx3p KNAG_0C04380 [Huiozyma naganishii CBS 8797]|uniref:Thioesterase domain-containing protein n=1 Tax=Huiozyma naganishii (strain ATCC MYA-139 / BCRC 22969 / CBS 8797 / KCTC 17520 / NBRC 10181 / NCYC 3082 / Yp74L-3) TaxID=1071383 RepID=J7R3Y5_HUIN7|nr:hypothetical protein KNAG_0C04380 [Kazachstania naganishii CBS 8797]CCK69540.1 hypothetical protein KNAG_0C04380 [Kazachstania naganishii CBS 8797]